MHRNTWIPPRADTLAKRAGMVFEDKAHLKLRDLFAEGYLKSPAFHFVDDFGSHCCIPDGVILLQPDSVPVLCVVEVKLTHTPDSWWQLRKLYGPVCQHYFGQRPKVLEIVKNYEQSVPFPERVELVYEIFDHVLNGKPDDFGVLRWKL